MTDVDEFLTSVGVGEDPNESNLDKFLSHYGIKGMKWGVRRQRGSNGRVSTEAKRADDILVKAKTHGPKSLTNKELGDLNKRLQLEKQFSQLNVQKPGPSKAIVDFISDIGKTQAKSAINAAISAQVKTAMGPRVPQKGHTKEIAQLQKLSAQKPKVKKARK